MAFGPHLPREAEEWIAAYLNKRPPPLPFSFSLANLSSFTQKVLTLLAEIPFGTCITYKELAERVGNPNACRAVGTACGKNPYPLFIPCHRIVASNGIGGFSSNLEFKKYLLWHESCFPLRYNRRSKWNNNNSCKKLLT
ncbi:MAG: methylated-DNA--[protein]-cysteine S-methyltransferase [Chlamydiales bacterium]|nr:methylated-DNA--[protein]-cysteine S-methyltransferase [Chlamydiales bacterium]